MKETIGSAAITPHFFALKDSAPLVHSEQLGEVLRFEEFLAVFRDDGRQNAKQLSTELFKSGGEEGVWEEVVDRLYDDPALGLRFERGFIGRLQEVVAGHQALQVLHVAPSVVVRAEGRGAIEDRWMDGFVGEHQSLIHLRSVVRSKSQSLAQSPIETQILSFYISPLGRKLFDLELRARREFLDPDVRQRIELERIRMRYLDDPKLQRMRGFILSTNVVDLNVSTSFKSLEAFEVGLLQARGKARFGLNEQEMTALELRTLRLEDDITGWLEAYMLHAYSMLSDQEWQEFSQFMQSDAGRAYQEAIFAGYSAALVPVMRSLGCEVGWALHGRKV